MKKEINIVSTHILKKVKIWLKSRLVLLGCITSWHISSTSPSPAWIYFCKTLHTWVLSLNMTGWLEDLADLGQIHATNPGHCSETSWVSGDIPSSDLKASVHLAFILFYVVLIIFCHSQNPWTFLSSLPTSAFLICLLSFLGGIKK